MAILELPVEFGWLKSGSKLFIFHGTIGGEFWIILLGRHLDGNGVWGRGSIQGVSAIIRPQWRGGVNSCVSEAHPSAQTIHIWA